METSIVIAGFGGQGVLFAGKLLAYAAMDSGKNVTWIPSYGPEMRGGTANCTVVISDEPIGAPMVANPDIALALNQPSFDKYDPLVKPGGLFIVNASLVAAKSDRPDLEPVYLLANDIAAQFGSSKMLNVAILGALLKRRPLLALEAVETALQEHLPPSKRHLLEANSQVLRQGYEAVEPVETRPQFSLSTPFGGNHV